jgi:hypothetical protein
MPRFLRQPQPEPQMYLQLLQHARLVLNLKRKQTELRQRQILEYLAEAWIHLKRQPQPQMLPILKHVQSAVYMIYQVSKQCLTTLPDLDS